jgi:LacI family transcriptional regulator
MPARPTLRTIAARTGLAVATVSRALHDASDIGDETKRRVREAARELGYRPNRAGVRLRTGKTNVIALVLSTEQNVMNHTARLMFSLSAALRGTAFHMIVTPFTPGDDPMEPVRYIAETGSADGVILNQTRPNDPRIRYLHDRGIPFATHGRTDMGIAHPYFDFDNHRYAEICVAELARRGRRRLALLAPPEGQSYADHMRNGFAAACRAAGIEGQVVAGVTSDAPMPLIESRFAAMMGRDEHPDGLISGSTSAAMAMVAGADMAGLAIGRDYDLVAKEAVPVLKLFRKDMIVVHEDVGQAGEFLAQALMQAISGATGPALQRLDLPVPPD